MASVMAARASSLIAPSQTFTSFKGQTLQTTTLICHPRRGIQCSSAEGPKLVAPGLPSEFAPPSPPSTPAQAAKAPAAKEGTSSTTIEFQRQKAKELVAYFEERRYQEEVAKNRIFGWTEKNEVGNGRWAMFGIAVGLLTEYATGQDFVEQLKLMINYLGIADV